MVFFVMSLTGFEKLREFGCEHQIWLNSDLLSKSELVDLRKNGQLLTEFVNRIDPNDQIAVSTAIESIREHHPGEVVWVEH